MNEDKEILEKLNLTPTLNIEECAESSSLVKTTETSNLTKAQLMWESLKNTELNLFGLSGQKLCDYCSPLNADPNKLYLKLLSHKKSVTVVGSVLYDLLQNKYNVELVDQYYVISEK